MPRAQFTPTPEMLELKARVETLLKARSFDKAEIARRDLIKQEQHDRRAFAESLWRSWGCRRNKLAYKQSIERSRCESDISAAKAKFQVDRKESIAVVERHHNYQVQGTQERYNKLSIEARTSTRNAKLRLPPVSGASGSIPVSLEDAASEDGAGATFVPHGDVVQQGWLFRKCHTKRSVVDKGKLTGPAGRRAVRTKRSQSAGGQIAPMKWERLYAVMIAHEGIFLYNGRDAFASGCDANAHVDLSNAELSVSPEPPNNNLSRKLVFELINACITTRPSTNEAGDRSSSSIGTTGTEGQQYTTKEIRTLHLQPESKQEFTAWEEKLAMCMPRHGLDASGPVLGTDLDKSWASASAPRWH